MKVYKTGPYSYTLRVTVTVQYDPQWDNYPNDFNI